MAAENALKTALEAWCSANGQESSDKFYDHVVATARRQQKEGRMANVQFKTTVDIPLAKFAASNPVKARVEMHVGDSAVAEVHDHTRQFFLLGAKFQQISSAYGAPVYMNTNLLEVFDGKSAGDTPGYAYCLNPSNKEVMMPVEMFNMKTVRARGDRTMLLRNAVLQDVLAYTVEIGEAIVALDCSLLARLCSDLPSVLSLGNGFVAFPKQAVQARLSDPAFGFHLPGHLDNVVLTFLPDSVPEGATTTTITSKVEMEVNLGFVTWPLRNPQDPPALLQLDDTSFHSLV